MMTVYGDAEAAFVLIQPVDKHELEGMEAEVGEIRRLTDKSFCLRAIKADKWNDALSPWQAPAVFGERGFGGRAEDTLAEILKDCKDTDKTYIIGGYSLAGLFALWAATRTDAFSAVAAASPSVWFPGFYEYAEEKRIRAKAVYLSLGDKEEKTRNPVMATVGDNIRKLHELLKERGTDTALEWNPGNHFRDADIRTAKAFAWVMEEMRLAKEAAEHFD